ncbi:MAG: hypothetical protein E7313_05795 [Clostridiales bacterium]|nr:hypothetical protein [Clostridiales bacterium]
MGKKVVFGSIFFLLILVCCVLFVRKGEAKPEFFLEKVEDINFVLVKQNNKYGVLNKKGEIVVNPIYDEVQIPNPSKPVFICKYNYDDISKEYDIKVLNEKSEQILYQYVIIDAIENKGIDSKYPYEKSILKYKENGKYGLIDLNGNAILKAQFDEIESLEYRENVLLLKYNGKYGIINLRDSLIIKNMYDTIKSDTYYEEETGYKKSGYIVGTAENNEYKYGYIDNRGNEILQNEYSQIERFINNEDDIYLVAFKGDKAGFYINNKKILEHEYEDIYYDNKNKCLVVQKDSKQGVLDVFGNVIINIEYDNISILGKYINAYKKNEVDIFDFYNKEKLNYKNIVAIDEINNNYSILIDKNEKYKILEINTEKIVSKDYNYIESIDNDLFIVKKNQKYGLIDITGKEIIKCNYDIIEKIEGTQIIKAYNKENNITNLIVGDEIKYTLKNSTIYLNKDYLQILVNGLEWKYIDYQGNEVININLFDRDMYSYKSGNLYGFVDKNNKIIVEPQYDFVTEFNEFGYAGIMNNGKWGCINSSGEILVNPKYTIEIGLPEFIGEYLLVYEGYGQPYYYK